MQNKNNRSLNNEQSFTLNRFLETCSLGDKNEVSMLNMFSNKSDYLAKQDDGFAIDVIRRRFYAENGFMNLCLLVASLTYLAESEQSLIKRQEYIENLNNDEFFSWLLYFYRPSMGMSYNPKDLQLH